MKRYRKSIMISLCLGLAIVLMNGAARGQAVRRILILPFQIHAREDLSFLKKGIADMLSSRLVQEGKVELINPEAALTGEPEPADAAAALKLGVRVKADYVVFGSLTLFGDSISTDARLIDVAQQKPVVIFNRLGQSRDAAIEHVNAFADQINADIFGRTETVRRPAAAPGGGVPDSRRHPEKVFNESSGLGSDYSFNRPGESRALDFTIWRSRNYGMHIKGLAVGDVDGDGLKETVTISDDAITIFRHHGGRFQKLAEIKNDTQVVLVTVDVADINANGRAEIFVTAEDLTGDERANYITKRLRSFVLEWNGTAYARLVDDQHWYYRVIRVPDRGDKLLAQRRGFEDLFRGPVYAMAWVNGGYEQADRQRLPRGVNVYSYTMGDVKNDGQEAIVAFTPTDYLRVYTGDREKEWESGEQMGGSNIFFEVPDKGSSPQDPVPDRENHYIAQRIQVADLDNNGRNEVIVVDNRDSFKKVFSKIRSFKSGYVQSLEWDALGLHLNWRTRSVSGYISDCAVADFDNDGRLEVVFAVDTDPNPWLEKNAKSYVVSWRPKPQSAAPKK